MGGTSMPLSRENILDTCKAARYSGIGTPLAGSRALRMYRCVRLILMSLRPCATTCPRRSRRPWPASPSLPPPASSRSGHPSRPGPECKRAGGGGPGAHGSAEHRRHAPAVLVLEKAPRHIVGRHCTGTGTGTGTEMITPRQVPEQDRLRASYFIAHRGTRATHKHVIRRCCGRSAPLEERFNPTSQSPHFVGRAPFG